MLHPRTIVTTTKVKFKWAERIQILFGHQMNVTTHIHVDREVREARKSTKIAFLYNPRKKEQQNPETVSLPQKRQLIIVKSPKDEK